MSSHDVASLRLSRGGPLVTAIAAEARRLTGGVLPLHYCVCLFLGRMRRTLKWWFVVLMGLSTVGIEDMYVHGYVRAWCLAAPVCWSRLFRVTDAGASLVVPFTSRSIMYMPGVHDKGDLCLDTTVAPFAISTNDNN